MSFPSIFEYLPEQAQNLCKIAALDPRPLINAIPMISAGVGGIAGGLQERDQGLGGALGGVVRGAAGAGIGALVGHRAGMLGGGLVGALTGVNSAGPINDTDAHTNGAAHGGAAVGSALGGLLGATRGYRLAMSNREEKTAEKEPTPAQRAGSVAKTVGTGLLGFGMGSLAGAGGAALLDKWHEAATGKKIPLSALHAAAPVVGGAMGLAYNIYKARELEELRRALESKSNRPQGRIPHQ